MHVAHMSAAPGAATANSAIDIDDVSERLAGIDGIDALLLSSCKPRCAHAHLADGRPFALPGSAGKSSRDDRQLDWRRPCAMTDGGLTMLVLDSAGGREGAAARRSR